MSEESGFRIRGQRNIQNSRIPLEYQTPKVLKIWTVPKVVGKRTLGDLTSVT